MEKLNQSNKFTDENKIESESGLLGVTKDGYKVFDRFDSHIKTHVGAEKIIAEALSLVSTDGQDFFKETLDFKRTIGETICTETTDKDEIIFAQRANRRGLTRFTKTGLPKPCSKLTLIIVKREEDSSSEDDEDDNDEDENSNPSVYYELITAYVGESAPPEPWDEKAFYFAEDPDKARQTSLDFWNRHALVFSAEEHLSGTETIEKPW